MHFGSPQVLWLLLAWPLFVLLAWWTLRWRRRMAQRLGDAGQIERLYPPSVRRWHRRRTVLALTVLLLLIMAASRPQYGQYEENVKSVGVNVLVAIDTSPSMDARDVIPSRLERAKQSLRTLVRQLRGNRVGVIAFSGDAILQCPMTLDYEMVGLMLQALDTHTISQAGTDIGRAIEVAIDAFENGSGEGSRSLVLITDGEDHEGRALEMAKKAAEKDISIYAIGIGSERGSPLMEDNGKFMEDAQGNKINTRLDMKGLLEIAEATGGSALDAGTAPERVIAAIAKTIEAREKAMYEGKRHVVYQERYQWFLGPAIFLLFLMLWLRPAQTRFDWKMDLVTPEDRERDGIGAGRNQTAS